MPKRALWWHGLCVTRAYRVRMSELFSILPPWFFILLGVGVLDALIQWSDYREWRKDHRKSEE